MVLLVFSACYQTRQQEDESSVSFAQRCRFLLFSIIVIRETTPLLTEMSEAPTGITKSYWEWFLLVLFNLKSEQKLF
jgi:hypothetical protein